MPPCTCAIAMARHTASNCENKTIQVVGNMVERPRAHSPACRLLKRVLQNSQMAVRGSLARAQRQWKCEAVSGSHALLSGRGKSQDRGAFNALHAKGGSGAPHAAHAQQMSKQAAKREAIRSGSLSDLLSVIGASYCICTRVGRWERGRALPGAVSRLHAVAGSGGHTWGAAGAGHARVPFVLEHRWC